MGLSLGSGSGRLDSCGLRGGFVSSQGPLGAWATLGKLKQRPTMASFPPWAASEQGLHGRPLGAPVISCAGCGAPGQTQWAGSGAGHLLPTRRAGPLRPEELPWHPLPRAYLAEACPAHVCPGFPERKPDPVPTDLSPLQTPCAPPSAREAVFLTP